MASQSFIPPTYVNIMFTLSANITDLTKTRQIHKQIAGKKMLRSIFLVLLPTWGQQLMTIGNVTGNSTRTFYIYLRNRR